MLAQRDPLDAWSEEDKSAFRTFVGAEPPPPPPPPRPGTVPDKAWLVKGANVEGVNLVPEWIEQGYVSIGWPELGKELPATRNELTELIRDTYPDDPPGAWYTAAGNLDRFVNQMQPGHLVLTVAGDALYVGRVVGDLAYESEGLPGAVRRRRIEWLNAASQRAGLRSRRRTRRSTRGCGRGSRSPTSRRT